MDVPFQMDASILASVADAMNRINQTLGNGANTATDSAFSARLEKALERNFNYIRKKDAALLQSSMGFPSSVPPPPKPPSFSAKLPTRLGIGAASSAPPAAQETGKRTNVTATAAGAESPSVYVSKLPTDITEEELEIFFGALGRVKKVKLYTTPLGQRKGDALVTFAQAEHAATACLKFNGLDIGDGHVISVTRAEFGGTHTSGPGASDRAEIGSGKQQQQQQQQQQAPQVNQTPLQSAFTQQSSALPAQPQPQTQQQQSPLYLQQDQEERRRNDALLCRTLPADTEAGVHPVAVIMNLFDPLTADDQPADFFDELEADMLLECCKFGKVRTVQLLNLPAAFLSAVFANMRGTTAASALSMSAAGALAVTFGALSSARECTAAMNGRKFDGRQLLTYVVPPIDMEEQVPMSRKNAAAAAVTVPPPPPPPPRPPSAKPPSTAPSAQVLTGSSVIDGGVAVGIDQGVDIEGISNNVDDFLSSLL